MSHLIAKATFTFICLLVPLWASAETLEIYANLTGKTVLRPAALPALPDSIVQFDANKLRLGHITELRKGTAKPDAKQQPKP